MTDEALIFDRHAFAHKAMRRDLTTRAYTSVLLNLDKRADLRFWSNRTTVQVDQIGLKDAYVATEFYVCCDGHCCSSSKRDSA